MPDEDTPPKTKELHSVSNLLAYILGLFGVGVGCLVIVLEQIATGVGILAFIAIGVVGSSILFKVVDKKWLRAIIMLPVWACSFLFVALFVWAQGQHKKRPEALPPLAASKGKEDEPRPTMLSLFRSDDGNLCIENQVILHEQNITGTHTQTTDYESFVRLMYPLSGGGKYVRCYVPFCAHPVEALEWLAGYIQKELFETESKLITTGKMPFTMTGPTKYADYVFTGSVTVYSESIFNPQQVVHLMDLYSKKKMKLEMFGSDYLLHQTSLWDERHTRK